MNSYETENAFYISPIVFISLTLWSSTFLNFLLGETGTINVIYLVELWWGLNDLHKHKALGNCYSYLQSMHQSNLVCPGCVLGSLIVACWPWSFLHSRLLPTVTWYASVPTSNNKTFLTRCTNPQVPPPDHCHLSLGDRFPCQTTKGQSPCLFSCKGTQAPVQHSCPCPSTSALHIATAYAILAHPSPTIDLSI